jgi:hypothetical protein
MTDSVAAQILRILGAGPQASPDLYDALFKLGIGRSRAKTATSRLLGDETIRQARLALGKGAAILLADGQEITAPFVRRLVKRNFYGRPALSSLVHCLRLTHSALSRVDVAKLAVLEVGTADNPDWTEVDSVIAGLIDLGILKEQPIDGPQQFWIADKQFMLRARLGFAKDNANASFVAVREKVRLKATAALTDWLEKNGFVAHGASRHAADGSPLVSAFGSPFDVYGLNYAAGIANRRANPVPGRVVIGDVLLGNCVQAYAASFDRRVHEVAAKSQRQPIRFVLSKHFTAPAFKLLRHSGTLIWTFDQLLGQKTADALTQVVLVIEQLVRQQQIDPIAFAAAFDDLQNSGTLFGSLKGTLFELLVSYYFQARGYRCRMAWDITDGRRSYDVDILASLNREAVIVECKGIGRDKVVPYKDVKRHFVERCPVARSLLLKSQPSQAIKFKAVIATAGQFDDETKSALDNAVLASRDDTDFELWDRSVLLGRLADDGHRLLAEAVEKYY